MGSQEYYVEDEELDFDSELTESDDEDEDGFDVDFNDERVSKIKARRRDVNLVKDRIYQLQEEKRIRELTADIYTYEFD